MKYKYIIEFIMNNRVFFFLFFSYVIFYKFIFLYVLSFSGDSRFFYNETLTDISIVPEAWDSIVDTGIGMSRVPLLWLSAYFSFAVFLSRLGIAWEFVIYIVWYIPSVLLSFLGSFFLYRYSFLRSNTQAALAGFLYGINTYMLMILLGGQLGIIVAYSLFPFLLLAVVRLINKPNLKVSILAGFVFSLQVLTAVMMAYVSVFAVGILLLFSKPNNLTIRNFFLVFVLPFVITFLLHTYLIFPLLFLQNASVSGYVNNIASLQFFSFADFSHTLSLLHPNWPENIFGKVSFLKPEFLLLPILAFSSLLFIERKQKSEKRNMYILFFAFLALVGAFLAKGAQEPFGFIYIWMFENIPGFIMFRDPTKWYTLIALSYAMLIPFSISQIYESLGKYKVFTMKNTVFKKYITVQNIFLLLVSLYLIFLIRPAWMGELGGTFKQSPVPNEYVDLKNFLYEDKVFSRTFWVPQKQRFGFVSNTHPGISAQNFFDVASPSGVIDSLRDINTEELLQNASVKYVIVPFDVKGEIFLTDREFDVREYERTVSGLDQIDWLRRVKTFGDIIVYEVENPKDHFYTDGVGEVVSWERMSATEYTVSVTPDTETLIFSEGFDPGWMAYSDEGQISSTTYSTLFNSFEITPGVTDLRIYYTPQKYVLPGLIVSGMTLLVLGTVLVLIKKKS